MKRIISLVIVMLLLLCGCAQEPVHDETTDTYDRTMTTMIYGASVDVYSIDGFFYADINLSETIKLANVGTSILETKEAFESVIPADLRGAYSVSYTIDGTYPSTIKFTSTDYREGGDDFCGSLSDDRSGQEEITEMNSLEDLYKEFPAAKIAAQKSDALSDEEMAMYDEVMDYLNSHMELSESEIYDLLAPDYNMTATELEAFIKDALSRIY